jgi:hypothetical protein
MFDWDRVDLDGNPRPLNIERGLENLDMSCKGNVVETDYISKPVLVDSGKYWNKFNLPTHPKHYYEINRFELETQVQIETRNQCHILNLVEGSEIEVLTKNRKIRINFAETFVIPAAVGIYTILNLGSSKAKVIQANVKPEFCETYNLKNNEIK